jgi:hypothetical protein
MGIESTSLTVFYFFHGSSAWKDWCERIRRRYGLIADSIHENIWRSPDDLHILLNAEQVRDGYVIRMKMSDGGSSSLSQWYFFLQKLIGFHKQLLNSEQGCLGTTLLYTGIAKEIDDNKWLAQVPTQDVLPAPQSVSLSCGTLWQLQRLCSGKRRESVYALLSSPTQTSDMDTCLIYHPAFLASEFAWHMTCATWQKHTLSSPDSWQTLNRMVITNKHHYLEAMRALISERSQNALMMETVAYFQRWSETVAMELQGFSYQMWEKSDNQQQQILLQQAQTDRWLKKASLVGVTLWSLLEIWQQRLLMMPFGR